MMEIFIYVLGSIFSVFSLLSSISFYLKIRVLRNQLLNVRLTIYKLDNYREWHLKRIRANEKRCSDLYNQVNQIKHKLK